MSKANASDIVKLLEVKHSKDLFFAEVKDGQTWGGAPCRLDGWAMRKSWARPCYFGYEIKVSRSDFLADEKWTGYLDLCNQFWFVTPRGIVKDGELPAEAGLIELTKTGTRLVTKKKAPHRTIEEPVDLLKYLLMSRVVPGRPGWGEGPRNERAYWEKWLEDRKVDHHFGRRVSGEIRRVVNDEMFRLENENRVLESKNARLEAIRVLCDELGVDPNRWDAQRKLRDAAAAVPPDLDDALSQVVQAASRAKQNLDALRAAAQESAA